MKAKALLLVGLLAGGSALAQTTSLNIVGYVNVTVPGAKGGATKYSMIANPLKATSNKVSDVIKLGPADDLVLFHYAGAAGFKSSEASGGEWLDGGDTIIVPGGGFFAAAATGDVKITFVGEVDIAGAVAGTEIPKGFSIRSSVLPKAGRLADLEYPLGAGNDDSDTIFQLVNGAYVETGGSSGSWLDDSGKGPQVGVAEAFWVLRSGSVATWKQPSATSLLQ